MKKAFCIIRGIYLSVIEKLSAHLRAKEEEKNKGKEKEEKGKNSDISQTLIFPLSRGPNSTSPVGYIGKIPDKRFTSLSDAAFLLRLSHVIRIFTRGGHQYRPWSSWTPIPSPIRSPQSLLVIQDAVETHRLDPETAEQRNCAECTHRRPDNL